MDCGIFGQETWREKLSLRHKVTFVKYDTLNRTCCPWLPQVFPTYLWIKNMIECLSWGVKLDGYYCSTKKGSQSSSPACPIFHTALREREGEWRGGERALISFHFLPGKKKMPLTQIMPPKAKEKTENARGFGNVTRESRNLGLVLSKCHELKNR